MAKEYIEREAAIKEIYTWRFDVFGATKPKAKIFEQIASISAADVAPVTETNDAVDEALRVLDAHNSGCYITYQTYCNLHNAICSIKKRARMVKESNDD